MNKNKLLAILALHGDSCENLAHALGITPQTFSKKLNEKGSRGFTQSEILAIKEKYCLSAEDIDGIFFNSKVS